MIGWIFASLRTSIIEPGLGKSGSSSATTFGASVWGSGIEE